MPYKKNSWKHNWLQIFRCHIDSIIKKRNNRQYFRRALRQEKDRNFSISRIFNMLSQDSYSRRRVDTRKKWEEKSGKEKREKKKKNYVLVENYRSPSRAPVEAISFKQCFSFVARTCTTDDTAISKGLLFMCKTSERTLDNLDWKQSYFLRTQATWAGSRAVFEQKVWSAWG